MQLFYSEHILDTIHFLPEDESKHLVRVLRKKFGDTIHLTDGKGHLFECRIVDDHPRRCSLEVVNKQWWENPMKREVHLAFAPTKSNDRTEWFVEKAVEIGVTTITPLVCDHSERTKLKPERLQKLAISAMKQSNRFYLPKLNKLISFVEFVESHHSHQRLIAHCHAGNKTELIKLELQSQVTLLIGPEGDFSDAEVIKANEYGYESVSLGKARLRTETAAISACTLLNHID